MTDTSKTAFGLDQIQNPTPEFAKWIFRGYFIISKAIIGWLAAVAILSTTQQLFVITTISLLIDPIMLGFSKLFGVVPEAADPAKPFVAAAQPDDNGDTKTITPVILPPQPVNDAPEPAAD